MGTDKPRFSMTMEKSMLEKVKSYQETINISNRNTAIQKLLGIGLKIVNEKEYPINADEFSEEERELVSSFRKLNKEGKRHILSVLKHELSLLEKLRVMQNKADEYTENHTDTENGKFRLIAYYNKIAAAGHAIDSFSDLMQGTIKVEDSQESRSADFAIGVLGESMAPTFFDGDIVLVKKQYGIKPGEIGIFQKDNGVYIKEMREDGLYSHNPKYKPIKDDSEVRLLGKVLGKAVIV